MSRYKPQIGANDQLIRWPTTKGLQGVQDGFLSEVPKKEGANRSSSFDPPLPSRRWSRRPPARYPEQSPAPEGIKGVTDSPAGREVRLCRKHVNPRHRGSGGSASDSGE